MAAWVGVAAGAMLICGYNTGFTVLTCPRSHGPSSSIATFPSANIVRSWYQARPLGAKGAFTTRIIWLNASTVFGALHVMVPSDLLKSLPWPRTHCMHETYASSMVEGS